MPTVTKQVNKYTLPALSGELSIQSNYKVVFCGFDMDRNLCVWIEVETGSKPWKIEYDVIATGETFDSAQNWNHAASIMNMAGDVNHLYIRDI